MKRYKIIDQRPEASKKTVEGYKDFESLLSKQGARAGGSSFKLLKSLAITGVVVLIGYLSVVYMFIHQKEDTQDVLEPISLNENKLPAVTKDVVKTPIVRTEKQTKVSEEPELETLPESEVKEQLIDRSEKPIQEKSEKEIAEYTYIEAEPMDGIAALYEYFDRTLKYPEEALADSIQGVTFVTFAININGEAEEITIDKSLGPLFDAEALRLIREMPKWRPASINGSSIKSKVSIPLTFRIEE